MNCLVTAGPTYEPLDRVRRLTNSSTGELGIRLSQALMEAGHRVVLLLGELSSYPERPRADVVRRFGTTEELAQRLQQCAEEESCGAVFHAAAVSDFRPGAIWHGTAPGQGQRMQSGKIPSDLQPLWMELLSTPKLIERLRNWFPRAWIVGWKYVVDGTPAEALAAGWTQIRGCHTNACVVNGPAYGVGFALLEPGRPIQSFADRSSLARALAERCTQEEREASNPVHGAGSP